MGRRLLPACCRRRSSLLQQLGVCFFVTTTAIAAKRNGGSVFHIKRGDERGRVTPPLSARCWGGQGADSRHGVWRPHRPLGAANRLQPFTSHHTPHVWQHIATAAHSSDDTSTSTRMSMRIIAYSIRLQLTSQQHNKNAMQFGHDEVRLKTKYLLVVVC